MPRRNQIQPDPAAQHTHDCLLGRHERVTVRAGLAISRRLQQEQLCWRFGCDWFLDLPYRVVAIRQVLNTGDAHRARQHVCPVGSPDTAGGFAGVRSCDATVFGLLFCTLYDISCSVGLLLLGWGCYICFVHKTYAAAPTQPVSFATAAQHGLASFDGLASFEPLLDNYRTLSRACFFLNFYTSSRPDLPTLGPFAPFFASGVDSRPKKSNSCLISQPGPWVGAMRCNFFENC